MITLPKTAFESKTVSGKHELLRLIDEGTLPMMASSFICGGAVRNLILGRELNSDIDFFFTSKEAAETMAMRLKENGVKLVAENEWNSSWRLQAEKEYEIQLIKIYSKTVEEIIDRFDFTICQFALDIQNIYCGDLSLLDLGGMKLVPHKITYPTASLRRVIKYAKKGFYMCAGAAKSFLEKCAESQRDNPDNIEIQYID